MSGFIGVIVVHLASYNSTYIIDRCQAQDLPDDELLEKCKCSIYSLLSWPMHNHIPCVETGVNDVNAHMNLSYFELLWHLPKISFYVLLARRPSCRCFLCCWL